MLAREICGAEHPKQREQQVPRPSVGTVPGLSKDELGTRPVWLELATSGQCTRTFRELRSGETLGFTLMRNHWRILLSRGVTSDLQFRWIMAEAGRGQKRKHKKPPQYAAKETAVVEEVLRNGRILHMFCWWSHQDLLKEQRCDGKELGHVALSIAFAKGGDL